MKTERWSDKDIDLIANRLKSGAVVAFPTDTVYGLGVCYDQSEALTALKRAKGRPENKPIPLMIGNLRQARQVAEVSDRAWRMMKNFMPGALTVVLRKQPQVPDYVTNGLDTIAVRMPDDAFVLELINRCGCPLLVSSANRSSEMPGQDGAAVLRQLDGAIDAIVMGTAKGSQASTIIDCTGADLRILRSGPIDEQVLKKIWNEEQTEKRNEE